MGSDHDVHAPGRQRFARLPDLPGRRQPRQRGDLDRLAREALAQRLPVLLAQHGGRHEDGDLLAGGDRQVGRARRDLGLAEPDVAAHQAIHRTGPAHVRQHFFGGAALVGGVFERKARLELLVARVGRGEFEARQRLARGGHRQQFLGHFLHRPARAALALGPALPAQPVQRGRSLARAGVALHLAELSDREVELVAAGESQQQELLLHAAGHQLGETAVAADPVLRVHQQIVDLDLGQAVDGLAAASRPDQGSPGARAEDVLLGEQNPRLPGPVEAFDQRGDRHVDQAGSGPGVQRRLRRRGDREFERVVAQDVDQPLRRRGRRAEQAHAAAGLGPARQPIGERLQRSSDAAPPLDLPPQLPVVPGAQVQALFVGVWIRRTQRVQQDRPPREQRLPGVVSTQIEGVRIGGQPVLQARPLPAGVNLAAVLETSPAAGLRVVDHDQGGVRQVVEHALHALVQQRLQVLEAGRGVLPPERLVQRVEVRLGDARFAAQLAHALQQLVGRVGQTEGAWGDRHHVVDLVPGALGGRVEGTHRADLAEVEFDAHRAFELGREDVQDAAARGHFAALLDQRGVVVAGRDQHVEQRVPVDRHAALQVGRPAAQLGARRQPPQQRRKRRDQRQRLVRRGGEQRIETAHALSLDLRVGGEAIVGRRVVAREQNRFDPG